MSEGTFLIKNGWLVCSTGIQQQDIRITNGVFTEIGKQLTANPNEQVIDASGKYIFPD